jgi:hypothetical protein
MNLATRLCEYLSSRRTSPCSYELEARYGERLSEQIKYVIPGNEKGQSTNKRGFSRIPGNMKH